MAGLAAGLAAGAAQTSDFIGLVRSRISRAVQDPLLGPHLVSKLLPLVLSPEAKLLRPRLVACFGRLAGAPEAQLVDAAAAAELLHVASLVHDDVIDESDERRSKPTLHKITGTQIAVLAGDHLLAQSLVMTAGLGPRVVESAARAMALMSASATREVEFRGCGPRGEVLQIGRADLTGLAQGKTGALFAFCMESAALLAGKPELARRLSRAGVALGVAFQFRDDVIDLVGGAGKPRGADLRERNPNAVVCAALQLGLSVDWNGSEIPTLCDQLLNSRALSTVEGWIDEELERARAELAELAHDFEVRAIFERLKTEDHHARKKHHHL
ncbi:MAG: polyprenyl synthetase family protein [Oligoflexia bacterium]